MIFKLCHYVCTILPCRLDIFSLAKLLQKIQSGKKTVEIGVQHSCCRHT